MEVKCATRTVGVVLVPTPQSQRESERSILASQSEPLILGGILISSLRHNLVDDKVLVH